MQSKAGGKILKIILCIGVFIWLVYFNIHHSAGWSITAFTSALFLSSLIYILATLYGAVLSIFRYYLLSTIIFLGIVVFIITKIDKIPKMNPILEWLSVIAVCAVALYLLRCDICYLKTTGQSENPNSEESEDTK